MVPARRNTSRRGAGGRRTLLDAELTERICALIRGGIFDHVAAEACGISANTFYEWVARGSGRDPDRAPTEPYVSFAVAVRTAKAQGRAKRELEVAERDPFKWLRHGPGRDRPGKPGWTSGDSPPSGESVEQLVERVIVALASRGLIATGGVVPGPGARPQPGREAEETGAGGAE